MSYRYVQLEPGIRVINFLQVKKKKGGGGKREAPLQYFQNSFLSGTSCVQILQTFLKYFLGRILCFRTEELLKQSL